MSCELQFSVLVPEMFSLGLNFSYYCRRTLGRHPTPKTKGNRWGRERNSRGRRAPSGPGPPRETQICDKQNLREIRQHRKRILSGNGKGRHERLHFYRVLLPRTRLRSRQNDEQLQTRQTAHVPGELIHRFLEVREHPG